MVLGDAGSPQRQLALHQRATAMQQPCHELANMTGDKWLHFSRFRSSSDKAEVGQMLRNVSLSSVGKDTEKLSFTRHLRPFKVLDMACFFAG